jgi:hypothetical protein
MMSGSSHQRTLVRLHPGMSVWCQIRTWRHIPALPLELPGIKLRQP